MTGNSNGSASPLILLVDDHRGVVRALSGLLERHGYRVVGAYDGKEGYEKALELQPDLIILDIDMPILDGYEVARRLTERPETSFIPIIMLTVKGRTDNVPADNADEFDRRVIERTRAFDAGAVQFLSKPVKSPDLLAAVKGVLSVLGAD